MSRDCVSAYTDHQALAEALKQAAKPGDILLFKGSRGMHMEISLDYFLK
jgi:UDP-N-acetylmuramoyl-tripeptide--D-alanyl-D-alanine ligase